MALMNEPQPQYIGFWARVGASLIDTLLMAIILVPVGRLFGIGTSLESMQFDSPANIMVNGVLPAIAVIVFWIYRQATPGKMAIGAKIVDARTLGKPSNGQMVGRYFAYYLSTIVFLLGFIWVGFDARKQGWHDKLAGTLVISSR
jgi:uncharacterized RDD family membrane protein YckC